MEMMINLKVNKLALQTGIDIPFPRLETIIHQPKIREIAYLGEKDFFSAIGLICIDKDSISELKDNKEADNFTVFLSMLDLVPENKLNIENVFRILFTEFNDFEFTKESIIFKSENREKIITTNEIFLELQQYCGEIFCIKSNLNAEQSYNPQNDKAKEIRDKIMASRQKVHKQKANKEKNSGLILDSYVSSISVGMGIDLEKVCEYTVYQVYDLVERMVLKEQFFFGVFGSMISGEQNAENWTKELH